MTSQISLSRLSAMKKYLDQELELLSFRIQKLQIEKKKCEEAKECLESKRLTVNDEMLVPVTKTLFVAATIDSVDTILVDIGCNYRVEMKQKEATEFLKRHIKRISEVIEQKIKLAQTKVDQRDSIIEALQYREQATLASKVVDMSLKEVASVALTDF